MVDAVRGFFVVHIFDIDKHTKLWYTISVNKIMVTGGQYPRRVEARKRFACRPYVR